MKKLCLLIFICGFALGVNAQTKNETLEVISYNIHHGANKDEVLTIDKVGEFLKKYKVDLVGLQEVDSLCNRSGKTDQMKVLAEITGMHAAFGRHFPYDGGSYGLGLLSAFPLSDIRNDRITSKSVDGEKRSLALLSAIATLPDGRKIRFATVHFALDQPTRMLQAEEVLEFLKEDGSIPVILTGDLNAKPDNEAIELLQLDFSLTDAKLGNTFPVYEADRKIDYIMVSSKNLHSVKGAKVLDKEDHSDHLPLWSAVELKF
ncbi:endonuclease/exonuclease/phosphatase family protein [Albibacterium indicum]|uniref:endonuclease/exonuclease/phosphatase family protein n=1 Tax=Albibacterium indicum TaxID=2292082 RepID=UPI000E4753C6|nr:endonuclease/exonuclease/phosphatase family protein [Pedobacter indicus]